MKHDYEVKTAFDEAFKPGEKEVDQETVDKACKTVFEKAAEEHGSEGLYVSGIMNSDMGGVSFRFKRPAIGFRVEHFIECNVPKPPRKEEATDENKDPGNGDNEDDEPVDRLALLREAAEALKEDQFTKDGKPEVDAVNSFIEASEEELEPFTAAERDELWAKIKEE